MEARQVGVYNHALFYALLPGTPLVTRLILEVVNSTQYHLYDGHAAIMCPDTDYRVCSSAFFPTLSSVSFVRGCALRRDSAGWAVSTQSLVASGRCFPACSTTVLPG